MTSNLPSDTPVLVTPKPFWESKTVWANALFMAGALLMFLSTSAESGQLPFDIDLRWIVFLQGLLNLGLRFLTSAPVQGGAGSH